MRPCCWISSVTHQTLCFDAWSQSDAGPEQVVAGDRIGDLALFYDGDVQQVFLVHESNRVPNRGGFVSDVMISVHDPVGSHLAEVLTRFDRSKEVEFADEPDETACVVHDRRAGFMRGQKLESDR